MRRSFLVAVAVLVAGSGLLGCQSDGVPAPKVPIPPPPLPGAKAVYYRFPFAGRWRILRAHYGARQTDQTYALDLIPDQRQSGDSALNSSYPCHGQPVLADGPGVVVIAVDGIPENVPPRTNNYDQHGNYVVIDHQNGEFSLMAHLIPGSLKVRVGTPVETGTELGRCGNSGLSTLPHIHWQIMDAANAHGAHGIPPRFAPYSRNGGAPTAELPEKRDTVENK